MAPAGEWGVEEQGDARLRHLGADEARAECKHVGIVVLARELRREGIADARAATLRLSVYGDRNPDPRATDGNSIFRLARRDPLRELASKERIIDAFGTVGAKIANVMPLFAQPSGEFVLEQVAGVIGGESDAHGDCLGQAGRIRQCRKPLRSKDGASIVGKSKQRGEVMRRWIAGELERTIYVIVGLPIAIRGASLPGTPNSRSIRSLFAHRYWHPASMRELAELLIGLLLAPLAVPLAALWFTIKNGPIIRRREAKGSIAQFIEQLKLYSTSGIIGPWYYIFSLHRDGVRRAPSFLQRCETKRGIYALLKSRQASPLGDKRAFADYCARAGVRCVACELAIDGGVADPALIPDCDLFVKPLTASGGKGAERWDRVGKRRWSNGSAEVSDRELVERLQAQRRQFVVQRRVSPHPKLEELTSGALPTVRAITCLDERGRPEFMGAVFRMSIGANRTVDNFHAGGIACAISAESGQLGPASDLGSDARLGWCRDHPTTGARIKGTLLPYWREVKDLVTGAHEAFSDRVLIGWDVAVADDGPIIVEGNRGPDLDIMQRFMDLGFCDGHRLIDLIAHHLRVRGHLNFEEERRPSVIRMDAQRQ